jgi:hypothetical protein
MDLVVFVYKQFETCTTTESDKSFLTITEMVDTVGVASSDISRTVTSSGRVIKSELVAAAAPSELNFQNTPPRSETYTEYEYVLPLLPKNVIVPPEVVVIRITS